MYCINFHCSVRVRAHRAKNPDGQSGDHLVRHRGHPADAAVPVQHRRRDGPVLPIPVLARVLLRVHQRSTTEAEVTIKVGVLQRNPPKPRPPCKSPHPPNRQGRFRVRGPVSMTRPGVKTKNPQTYTVKKLTPVLEKVKQRSVIGSCHESWFQLFPLGFGYLKYMHCNF